MMPGLRWHRGIYANTLTFCCGQCFLVRSVGKQHIGIGGLHVQQSKAVNMEDVTMELDFITDLL